MGSYFKVIDKNRTDGHIDYIKAVEIYEAIEDIVGDKRHPNCIIPYKIEVDGWADLACEGEIYETRDFVVECLSFKEYNDYISEI